MAACLICQKEFFAKRSDAKTCGAKCRRLLWVQNEKVRPCPNCGWKKGDAIKEQIQATQSEVGCD